MRHVFWAMISAMPISLLATTTFAADLKAGGLTLQLDDKANVTAMTAGGRALKVAPSPLVSLCDVEKGQFAAATVTGDSSGTKWSLDFADTKVKAVLSISAKDDALRFLCDLQGEPSLPARGVLLRFTFPFDATGWQWANDMQTLSPISEGKVFENVVPLRAYADLPEWRDKPALRMGYCNRNFCTTLTGPAGVCLAVPLDRPCIFRTAYDGTNRRLEMVYDFALSPDTRQPNAVSFAFDLYACDPQWGFRSALAQYYKMYPDFFRCYVREQGQWQAFSKLSEIDNANEFYFALQEGAPEPEYDDKVGVLSTIYFTHAGMMGNIPNYDPEKDPLPPYETQVAAVNEAFKREMKVDGIYDKVGTMNAQGKLDVQKWSVYAHLLAQFNLDPELPWGDFLLKKTLADTERIKKQKNADLDGFYYDGLTTGINYNTAHFKTADSPCLWDPVAKKPYINNFFSSCEFARAVAEQLRTRGQITMMNGAVGDSFFVAPWLDIFGEETGLRIPRASFNYVRTVICHKPFMTLLKGNYEQKIARPEMELFMKRCLAYGVYPGFFDWPPSGLGPGGQYWNHPRYYERDRDLFRKYQPLCRTLALAGWEPVTHARSSAGDIFVERFGPTPDGMVWLTLLNEDTREHTTTLTVDAKALGLDAGAVKAVDVVSGVPVNMAVREGVLAADFEVPADGVMVVQLATPGVAAGWRVREALETLDRGVLMRKVDAEKPPIAVHWRPSGKTYVRETVDGKNHLTFAADEKSGASCRQWAMLFQPSPTAITLRVRAAAENLVGTKKARVRCQLAWVTPNYTHYKDEFLDFPEGTYGWQDFEFSIKSENALRSIQFIPLLDKGAKGTLKISRISVSDAGREEYVVNPEFEDWYEPIPASLRERVDKDLTALRAALVALENAMAQLPGGDSGKSIFDVFGQCEALRQYIAGEKAENGCRRVLRDLETIQRHLGMVAISVFGISPPEIKGRKTSAPGDTVTLSCVAPKVEGVPTRMELCAKDAPIAANAEGGTVTIPMEAAVGSTIEVVGLLHIGSPGRETVVNSTHPISIVPPLEVRLQSQGADSETGAARLRVVLRNNHNVPTTAGLTVSAPAGWQLTAPASLEIPAEGETTADVQLAPGGAAMAGSIEVGVAAKAGKDEAKAGLVMLYIPKEANLVKNPSFEDGDAGWHASNAGASVDRTVARSGKASLRMENPSTADSQASQNLLLNQKSSRAILVRTSSMAKNVSGAPDKGYSLYVDIYYTDGTSLYGRTHDFQTGTTAWQLGELYIEPAKPIKNVSVNLLLRGKAGTVWFDDVAVMEDPRRKGNIAPEARVTVDRNYAGYDPSPINDGVTQGEGLHWTKEAWASADEAQDHFIVLTFGQPRAIGRAVVYWSLDAGVPRTSQEVQFQVPEGDGWKTVAVATNAGLTPQTEIRLDAPVTCDRFRLLQPQGKGSPERRNLMWVREVELFPAP
ncbi:MAG: hypothetical protein A3K19_33990 [Lentisphaerae bacterium RIFOXYB12_FULL_65_16]|nr:MAG: hypothetical protein A3K19_23780 [Lentisphaerae bacterium RIFOXYB12_FULL_65_16]OGV95343.1 MAG: hypothetical protein A3K19_33990 [Lentisphaerae bacterium RIFOXYB12_FULL_65_16]